MIEYKTTAVSDFGAFGRSSSPGGKERRQNEMTMTYYPQGVCSRQFQIQLEDGVIQSVQVIGGCHGNLQGLSALLKGMSAQEAVARLEGIRCGDKPTSCPDQMTQALKCALREE